MDFKFDYKQKIVINGKEYSSLDELPPEMRETMKNALSKGFQANGMENVFKAFFGKSGFDFKTGGDADFKKVFDISFTTTKENFPKETAASNVKNTIDVTPISNASSASLPDIKPIEAEPTQSGRKVMLVAFIAFALITLLAYLLF